MAEILESFIYQLWLQVLPHKPLLLPYPRWWVLVLLNQALESVINYSIN